MRKFLALMCITAAIAALGWKGLSAALTPAPVPALSVSEPGGTAKPVTVRRDWIDVGPVRATEGANLLVTGQGLELVGNGGLIVSSPLGLAVERVLWWFVVLSALCAGFSLFRSDGRAGK